MRRFVLPLAVLVAAVAACEDQTTQPLLDSPESQLLASTAMAGGYVEIPLGHLGGGSTRAAAINARGDVTGRSTTADGGIRAFVWTARDGMRDLGTTRDPQPEHWWIAFDNNDGGKVVGHFYDGRDQSFFWTDKGGLTDFWCGSFGTWALSVSNSGTIVGLLEGLESRFPGFGWIHSPYGPSETAAFRYDDGVCSLIMDEEFIALTAWYVNRRGEIAGTGAPYVLEPHPYNPGEVYIVITGDVRPIVWSPGRGFLSGETLEDDRHRNPRGDYVEGGSLFTRTPGAYGAKPGKNASATIASTNAAGIEAHSGLSRALVSVGCPPIMELVQTTEPLLVDRCLAAARKAR
jgi:probable HAF family extracellular repeat protein